MKGKKLRFRRENSFNFSYDISDDVSVACNTDREKVFVLNLLSFSRGITIIPRGGRGLGQIFQNCLSLPSEKGSTLDEKNLLYTFFFCTDNLSFDLFCFLLARTRASHLERKARSGFSLYWSSFSGLSHLSKRIVGKPGCCLKRPLIRWPCIFTRLTASRGVTNQRLLSWRPYMKHEFWPVARLLYGIFWWNFTDV